ncbi:hypothetical protein Hanom_Chr12g01104571 [Helianthus anomalus]
MMVIIRYQPNTTLISSSISPMSNFYSTSTILKHTNKNLTCIIKQTPKVKQIHPW